MVAPVNAGDRPVTVAVVEEEKAIVPVTTLRTLYWAEGEAQEEDDPQLEISGGDWARSHTLVPSKR